MVLRSPDVSGVVCLHLVLRLTSPVDHTLVVSFDHRAHNMRHLFLSNYTNLLQLIIYPQVGVLELFARIKSQREILR